VKQHINSKACFTDTINLKVAVLPLCCKNFYIGNLKLLSYLRGMRAHTTTPAALAAAKANAKGKEKKSAKIAGSETKLSTSKKPS